MAALQAWLSRPRATVRIDTTIRWSGWLRTLQRSFADRIRNRQEQMEVLHRLPLGGKKALLLVTIEGRRFLVGLGGEAPPTVLPLHGPLHRRSTSRVSRRFKVVR